jgi:hypothetical protein
MAESLSSALGQRNNALLAPLSQDPDIATKEIDIPNIQTLELPDPQAGSVQQLDERTVSKPGSSLQRFFSR